MDQNDYYQKGNTDYNQDNGQSPYGSDPGRPNPQPNYFQQPSGMSVASLIFGIASIALLCCGGLGLPLGILGLAFALLSRKGRHMNAQTKLGFGLSLGGIGLAVVITAVQVILMFSSGNIEEMRNLMQKYDITTPSGAEDFMEDWEDYLYGVPPTNDAGGQQAPQIPDSGSNDFI